EVVRHAAVKLVAAGLDGVVGGTGAAELHACAAGDDRKLVDCIDGDCVGDRVVAALLRDVGDGNAFDVVFVEVGLAAAAVDAGVAIVGAGPVGGSGILLHAGHQVLEGGRIARAAVHGERKFGVKLVLNGAAERRVGGVEEGRSVGDGDGLFASTDSKLQREAENGGVVDGNILLKQALEAFGDDFNVVVAGLQRQQHILSEAVAGGAGCHAGFGSCSRDLRVAHYGALRVRYQDFDTAAAGALREERSPAKKRDCA